MIRLVCLLCAYFIGFRDCFSSEAIGQSFLFDFCDGKGKARRNTVSITKLSFSNIFLSVETDPKSVNGTVCK